MDVHLDGVVAHFLAPFAQALDQLLLAHQTPRTLQQHFQQAQFPCGKLHQPAIDGGHPPGLVVHQGAVLDGAAGAAHATTRERAHPRFQLLQAEGLGHVIVGAQVQPLDALFHRIRCRQDQHRQVVVAAAQAAQHFQTMHAGQPQIQNQQIKVVVHEQGGVGFGAIGHVVHHRPGISQAAQQAIGQHLIIFRYQDTHASGLLILLSMGTLLRCHT